jgi:hypothetical protein
MLATIALPALLVLFSVLLDIIAPMEFIDLSVHQILQTTTENIVQQG